MNILSTSAAVVGGIMIGCSVPSYAIGSFLDKTATDSGNSSLIGIAFLGKGIRVVSAVVGFAGLILVAAPIVAKTASVAKEYL